ncbi:MAG: Glu/Leu/Phe/Val dehydrogenase dimerization domain-containing protein, partial [Acidimicrobiales bacterium]
MEFLKLTSTDAFIVFDLDAAPAVGIVRQAPKVLKDGAELLARSTTYAMASFGLAIGGASAGINAKPDARDAALAAFIEEVAPLVESGRWLPGPGVGIATDELTGLARADERTVAFDQTAAGESAVAAALGALGSLDGAQVAIVGNGSITEA